MFRGYGVITVVAKNVGSPASSEKVAPSIAARYRRPGRMKPGRPPIRLTLAPGQFGVRAPVRYGSMVRPPQPGASAAASSVMAL